MKLTGTLKENVEKAESTEQAKELIAQAGMELTDDEMQKVSGGTSNSPIRHHFCEDCLYEWDGPEDEYLCPRCGREWTYVTDYYQ